MILSSSNFIDLVPLQQLGHIVRELDQPPGPIVSNILAPKVYPGRNIQTVELILQDAGIYLSLILPCALTTNDDDLAVTVLIYQIVLIRHLRQIVYGRVVVDIQIVETGEEITGME